MQYKLIFLLLGYNTNITNRLCYTKCYYSKAEYLVDVRLIYVRAMVKIGEISEAMKNFQRMKIAHIKVIPEGLRRATLIAELLFIQG